MIHHSKPGEKFFIPYRVRILRKIHDYPKGAILKAEDVPNRTVQILDSSNRILKSCAVENVDFEKI